MARSLGRLLVVVGLLAATVATAPGCTCNKSEVSVDDAAAFGGVVVEAPVAAPDGLLADVFVATPNASWQRVQRGVGGTLGILPSTLGSLTCALAGLDPSLGAEIDGAALATGAIADDPKDLAWALAMKIAEPRRARDVLFESETARYSPRPIAGGGMLLLAPKGGGRLSLAVALAPGGYLVIARNEDDLSRLGPYAYRTVPTKPVPEGGALVLDAPTTALKGPLRARVSSLWDAARGDLAKKDDAARAAHGGRAPDYGDPRAVLALLDGAMQSRLAMLGDLSRARVVVDVRETSLRADLVVTPGAADGPSSAAFSSMHPGDAAPLLEANDSPLAVLFRDDAGGRAQTAADVEDAVKKALGERLAEPEAKRLHGAIDGWTKARGDWTTLGLIGTDGLFVRTPATNGDAADHAIREFLSLVSVAPLKQGLRIHDVTVGAGTAQVVYGDPPAKGAQPKKANVAWGAKGGEIGVTVTTLTPPTSATPQTKKIGEDPVIASLVRALDATVTFAAVVQPLKLDPARANAAAAPAIVAWGKRAKGAYLRVEASDVLARELLKMRSGF